VAGRCVAQPKLNAASVHSSTRNRIFMQETLRCIQTISA
jgi:hypothetical protein